MSVTLLFSYPPYASGSTVTLDRATEAALVQQGRATYTNNPGPVFSPLTAVEEQALRDFLPLGQALVSGAGVPWASRVAAATAGVGALMWADLGNGLPPALFRSDGTYWKPVFRTTLLRKTTLTSGLIQVGDQTIGQLGPLPAGVLYPGAVFALRFGLGRNNGTDAFGSTTSLRIGTAGGGSAGSTPTDTAFTSANFSGTFPGAGSSLSVGIENWSVMASATSCARAGVGNANSSFVGNNQSGAALLTAVAIADVTANALFFTVSTNMAAATTTTPQTSVMELILEP